SSNPRIRGIRECGEISESGIGESGESGGSGDTIGESASASVEPQARTAELAEMGPTGFARVPRLLSYLPLRSHPVDSASPPILRLRDLPILRISGFSRFADSAIRRF